MRAPQVDVVHAPSVAHRREREGEAGGRGDRARARVRHPVRDNGRVTQPDPDRRIPEAAFPGDTGEVAPAVADALAAYAADPGRYAGPRCAALRKARLLVPVVAVLGEVEYDEAGLAHDKTSDMAAVLLRGDDGRLALLAFTGLEPLRAWNPEARPVPVAAQLAAQSAVQDGGGGPAGRRRRPDHGRGRGGGPARAGRRVDPGPGGRGGRLAPAC